MIEENRENRIREAGSDVFVPRCLVPTGHKRQGCLSG